MKEHVRTSEKRSSGTPTTCYEGLLSLKNRFQDYKNINNTFLLEHETHTNINMFLLECVINNTLVLHVKRTWIYKVYTSVSTYVTETQRFMSSLSCGNNLNLKCVLYGVCQVTVNFRRHHVSCTCTDTHGPPAVPTGSETERTGSDLTFGLFLTS